MSRATTDGQPSRTASYELHEKIARACLGIGWALVTVGVGAAAGLAARAAAQLDQAAPLATVTDIGDRRSATERHPADYAESPLEDSDPA